MAYKIKRKEKKKMSKKEFYKQYGEFIKGSLDIVLGRNGYAIPKERIPNLFATKLFKKGDKTVIVQITNLNTRKSYYRVEPKQRYYTRIYMPPPLQEIVTGIEYSKKKDALKKFKQLEEMI